mgnify:FL=1|eukprot:scaffold228784_cov37-Tisochrysis_lutea.AAC.1
MSPTRSCALLTLWALVGEASAAGAPVGRRAVVGQTVAAAAALVLTPHTAVGAKPQIDFSVAESGLRWADLKPGSGAAFRAGERVSIDYIMTRRGGSKIHSTVQAGEPFTWTIGDGTVITGLEQAVAGGSGVPPMLPGGARRVIIPMSLGYGTQTTMDSDRLWQTDVRELGPVPPDFVWLDPNNEKVNSYLRFKNLYQNPNAFNQPDLVFDIRLRATPATAMPTTEEEDE